MLILNPLKPIYKNVNNNLVRMGNFKNHAKELVCDNDSVIKLFDLLQKPISKRKLIEQMVIILNDVKQSEIENSINYLISEKFIISYTEYKNIVNSGRFNRQNLFFSMYSDEIKEWNIKRQPNILILGVGGIGSNVVEILYRSGFRDFTFVDCDKVDESNLIRQIPYNYNDIGKNKVNVLKERFLENEHIKCYNKKILECKDIEFEISKTDFVVSTLDRPLRKIRRMVNKLCVEYQKPVIFAGFSEHVGMVGPFIVPQKTACLKCMDRKLSTIPYENVAITPSYGPLCLVISSFVANEVINYYYKFNKNNLMGKTMMINMFDFSSKIIKWKKEQNCEVCGNDSKKYSKAN